MIIKTLTLSVLLLFSFVACAQRPVPKGERLLSIDLTMSSDDDFGKAFTLARSVGMQVTSLSLPWDELEPSPGHYATDPNWLEIANNFYSQQDVPISLALTPIDTNNLRLPAYLKDKAFDEPEVIERFKRLLDHVFSQIPDLELSSLAIGNEIDAYLNTDEKRWKQYQRFFEEVSVYAKSKRPGLIVGSKVTFGGLENVLEPIQMIVAASDVMMVTYYPLNNDFSVKNPEVVHEDFAKLVALFPDKPIYMLEAGYPSSPLLGSSKEKQAEFVQEIFRAWDTYAAHIKLLDFLWLHDISKASVEELGDYYGFHDEKFLAFLATLGLRTFDGEDKEAFKILRLEAKQRGW